MINLASGGYIKLNSYFEGVTISSGSGDIKGEGNTVNGIIELSKIEFPSGAVGSDGFIQIKSIQIYASGDAGKKIHLRELRAVDMNETVIELPADFLEDESVVDYESAEESDSGKLADGKTNGKSLTVIIISAIVVIISIALIIIMKRK